MCGVAAMKSGRPTNNTSSSWAKCQHQAFMSIIVSSSMLHKSSRVSSLKASKLSAPSSRVSCPSSQTPQSNSGHQCISSARPSTRKRNQKKPEQSRTIQIPIETPIVSSILWNPTSPNSQPRNPSPLVFPKPTHKIALVVKSQEWIPRACWVSRRCRVRKNICARLLCWRRR